MAQVEAPLPRESRKWASLTMNVWADLYWICFWVGFALSVVPLLAGPLHLHLSHGAPHIHLGALPGFLCWLGATGYLLAKHYATWSSLALMACAAATATA